MAILLFVLPFCFWGQGISIQLPGIMIFLTDRYYCWILASFLVLCWVVYLFGWRILLSQYLTNTHIAITIILICWLILNSKWFVPLPVGAPRTIIFRLLLNNSVKEIRLTSWKVIAFIGAQLCFLANIILGFIRRCKRTDPSSQATLQSKQATMRNFILICLVIFLNGCRNTQKVDYYLPMNYHGQAAVVYSNNGDIVIYKNNRQQIIIPESGIIFLKQKPFEGEIDYRYYIKTSNGFIEIDRYLPGVIDDNNKKLYVLSEETTSGLLIGKKGKTIYFDAFKFYIGNQSDTSINRKSFYFSKQLDSSIVEHN
jgi:hypothetical protein